LRRIVFSLITALMATSFIHSSHAVNQMNNVASKEKLVAVKITEKKIKAKSLVIKRMLSTVTASDIVKWSRVNICEMGGGRWNFQGTIYSGGLGIMNSTWVEHGGTFFASDAGYASKKEQIYVAKHIQGGYYVPDQNGCGKGW
jgi:Transglycosylase-like domain